jgi:hypothetical protein
VKALLLSIVPYARRALRVFAYAVIPAAAAWLTDNNWYNFEIGLRLAGSAALLALLDKGQIAFRAARK